MIDTRSIIQNARTKIPQDSNPPINCTSAQTIFPRWKRSIIPKIQLVIGIIASINVATQFSPRYAFFAIFFPSLQYVYSIMSKYVNIFCVI